MSEIRYKFLREVEGAMTSEHGECEWSVGKWQSVDGEIDLCENGFHCSRTVYHAFTYVQGEILAEVEVDGEHEDDTDKEAWQQMRVLRAWKWQKKDSVALSIFASELVLANYEAIFPDDDRPRKAIEAARRWHDAPSAENESAARSAESAARSAAWSARSAAWSAESAAESAAWSAARSAESAAWSAAWSAARSAESAKEQVIEAIVQWMQAQIAVLEPCE